MLAEDGDDEDVRSLLDEARAELEDLAPRIREAMIEPDPDDDRDTLVEIRAAAGGEEAALFARDLMDVYTRYAESRGLKVELMSSSEADAGGVREATIAVKGRGAFAVFKHEAGVHRVQRVPATESQGRIHTSTATVAVLRRGRGRGRQDRPQRRQARRLPLQRPRRAERQHHRLGRAPHPPADQHRRVDAGREEPAPELRARDARAARAPLRAGPGRARGRGVGGPQVAAGIGRPVGEGPHVQLPPEPGHRPPRRRDGAPARAGAGGQPVRPHRRARGRRAPPAPGGAVQPGRRA